MPDLFFAVVFGVVLISSGAPVMLQRLTTGHWPRTVGVSAVGIAAGAAVGGYWLARTTQRPVGATLDAVAPVWPLFLAIGRLGCFAAGCCWGKETDSWLGVHLRNVHGDWATRYPTQLMSAGANLAIFVGLLAFERYAQRRHRRSWPFSGFLFVLYIFCASLERFVLEWMRGDAIPVFGAWTWIHITTAGGMIVAVMIVLWYLRRLQQLTKEVTLPNQGNG
ncbi:MAG: prolipoprotein diacylglyceryl transferase [Anaerolineales bacterium]|nr:prolipoprotein diacylglyceryl transferase [Anaerolineales bacterium]